MMDDGETDRLVFRFRIPLLELEEKEASAEASSMRKPYVPVALKDSFNRDGFVVIPNVLSKVAVDALNDRLEDVLRGHYDREEKPDKVPRLLKCSKPIAKFNASSQSSEENEASTDVDEDLTRRKSRTKAGPIGFSGNLQNVKVLQIINIHKADSLFRKLETHSYLGHVVEKLTGWDGVRLAQDQVWAKPPGAPPLVFHRDSPYFMFEPSDVVTVWLALDDMDAELGPLEYVKRSHTWGNGRIGSASQFFQTNVTRLLRSAAEREGLNPDTDLDIVSMAGLQAGGISVHHGKIWHGSDKNNSRNRPRRGLGLHFVPAKVRFTAEASHSKLWKKYVANADNPCEVRLSEDDFPTVS